MRLIHIFKINKKPFIDQINLNDSVTKLSIFLTLTNLIRVPETLIFIYSNYFLLNIS